MTIDKPTIIGLFGAGGCGRGIMPFLREALDARLKDSRIVFIETTPTCREINGVPVVSEEEYLSDFGCDRYFNVALADPNTRAAIAKRFEDNGCIPLTLRAPQTTIYTNNEIGEGAIICANATITSNVKIGRYFHANIYSYVEHDCVIGDFVTFAPRVNCNGNVHIHDRAYIGTNASIIQGKTGAPLVIGEGAIVGMGAVVLENVPAHSTVVGNPARIIEKRLP